ncbi:hypothetical protein H1R20_g7544, partial [Candolleomyces eurysporus]
MALSLLKQSNTWEAEYSSPDLEPLKMLKQLPSGKEPTSYLYLLPSELLISICTSLDFRSLKAFACVSRLANSITVPIFIDQTCPEIKSKGICEISSVSKHTAYPFKLAFSVPPLRVHKVRLNFVTSHTHLLKAVQSAGIIISRMAPEIHEARLSFAVSQWGGLSRIKQSIDKIAWTRTIFAVFDALLDRGCRVLEIDGLNDDLRVLLGGDNYFHGTWQGTISKLLPSSDGEALRKLNKSRAPQTSLGSQKPLCICAIVCSNPSY